VAAMLTHWNKNEINQSALRSGFIILKRRINAGIKTRVNVVLYSSKHARELKSHDRVLFISPINERSII
jgi:hypothetical protein